MKDNSSPLKIFNFSHPLMNTEWLSIMGDKYSSAFSFKWQMVTDPNEAQILVWDGVLTPKNQSIIEPFITDKKPGRLFLLLGESLTLLKDNPMIRIINTEEIEHVPLFGWNILPEDILVALEKCHQKLNHV
jgi:Ni,Fe-hydrogenase III small subunit